MSPGGRRAAGLSAVVLAASLALLARAPARAAAPPAAASPLVLAVLPLDNRTAGVAPVDEVRWALVDQLAASGLTVLPDDTLEAFLAKYRVRYTGGVADDLAQALGAELGATGILVTTLDLYDDGDPPALALTARLLVPGSARGIAWIDGFAMVGDESPGFLGTAAVHEVATLIDRAAARLVRSLVDAAGADFAVRAEPAKGRFHPRRAWVADDFEMRRDPPARVAVLPFRNDSERRHAGDLVALQLLRQLATRTDLHVIDPGEVRRALLQARLVAEEGISGPQADTLRVVLGADLVWTGTVFEYVEGRPGSPPRINFTSVLFDTGAGRLVASTLSHNAGDDRVFFFDASRIWTGHGLASEMTAALVADLLQTTRTRSRER
jgi:hypothetical protein